MGPVKLNSINKNVILFQLLANNWLAENDVLIAARAPSTSIQQNYENSSFCFYVCSQMLYMLQVKNIHLKFLIVLSVCGSQAHYQKFFFSFLLIFNLFFTLTIIGSHFKMKWRICIKKQQLLVEIYFANALGKYNPKVLRCFKCIFKISI